MCMGDMVTVRRPARVSSVPMDIAAVEQSFGELLAALGDIVVARTRGAPADAAGGSTAALARRYRRGVGASDLPERCGPMATRWRRSPGRWRDGLRQRPPSRCWPTAAEIRPG